MIPVKADNDSEGNRIKTRYKRSIFPGIRDGLPRVFFIQDSDYVGCYVNGFIKVNNAGSGNIINGRKPVILSVLSD